MPNGGFMANLLISAPYRHPSRQTRLGGLMHLEPTHISQPRVGVLGAGRLGRALAERWYRKKQHKTLLWSRRFRTATSDATEGSDSFTIAPLDHVLKADVVIAAIPSKAIGEVASTHAPLARFDGALLAAGIDLPVAEINRFIPAATIVRVVPILLPGRDDVPSLVLDTARANPQWPACLDFLQTLGPIHSVDEEAAFDGVMHLTSPFSVTMRSAMKRAISDFLATRNVRPDWQPVAESIVWQALSAGQHQPPHDNSSGEAEVATPGGITEAGLREAGALSNAMVHVLSAMARRADELRALSVGA